MRLSKDADKFGTPAEHGPAFCEYNGALKLTGFHYKAPEITLAFVKLISHAREIP
jgi:hypothetical protein